VHGAGCRCARAAWQPAMAGAWAAAGLGAAHGAGRPPDVSPYSSRRVHLGAGECRSACAEPCCSAPSHTQCIATAFAYVENDDMAICRLSFAIWVCPLADAGQAWSVHASCCDAGGKCVRLVEVLVSLRCARWVT